MSSPLDGNGVALKRELEMAMAETWRRYGGWPGVESGMINMTGLLADAVMEVYARRSPAPSHTAVEPVALAYSGECIDIAREAFDAWASKPHNKRWFKRIDGTPIINDIIVNMAVTFGAHGVIAKRAPSDLMVPLSTLTAQAAALVAAERERDQAWSDLSKVAGAIGSVRFMDPPDGGDVTLAEQVARMREALESAEQSINKYAWERDKAREERDQAERRSEAFWKSRAESEAATLKARVAELDAGLEPPYEFDRYVNGVLMAEGVTIEAVTDLAKATLRAVRIASRGPNGEAPVLVLRARRLTHQEEEQWPVG